MMSVKKSKGEAASSMSVFGLWVKRAGRGDSKGDETLLSVYKSRKDADFIANLLVSEGKHTFPEFNLSEKDELFVKEIPAFVSFGKELPSEAETISRLEGELDKILESLCVPPDE